MPFIALDKSTKERIDILEIDQPRLKLKSGDCICQLCGEPMIVRSGPILRPHFAHYADCTSDFKPGHEETPEHLFAKRELKRLLCEQFGPSKIKIDYEVPIPEIKRVADVLVVFPMGWRVAHEVQLSGISSSDLEERTNDYLRAGIDVIWWLGKAANTERNRDWCVSKFGYALSIDFNSDQRNHPVTIAQIS